MSWGWAPGFQRLPTEAPRPRVSIRWNYTNQPARPWVRPRFRPQIWDNQPMMHPDRYSGNTRPRHQPDVRGGNDYRSRNNITVRPQSSVGPALSVTLPAGVTVTRVPLPSAQPPPAHPPHPKGPDLNPVNIRQSPFNTLEKTLCEGSLYNASPGPRVERIFSFVIDTVTGRTITQDKSYKVLLRFCKLDSVRVQPDYYPSDILGFINGRMVLFPGVNVLPKGPAEPIDITSMCHFSTPVKNNCNFLRVLSGESLKVFVVVVKKQSSDLLIERLTRKDVTPKEATAKKIQEKLCQDASADEIAPTDLQCSLLCPLSRVRLKLPCRASTCQHLQCFDAASYILLNEVKQKWSCPVCHQTAAYEDLEIDGYFKDILGAEGRHNTVVLLPDGSWRGLGEPPDDTVADTHTTTAALEATIDLDHDDDLREHHPVSADPHVRVASTNETITLSDGEDVSLNVSRGAPYSPVLCSTPRCANTNSAPRLPIPNAPFELPPGITLLAVSQPSGANNTLDTSTNTLANCSNISNSVPRTPKGPSINPSSLVTSTPIVNNLHRTYSPAKTRSNSNTRSNEPLPHPGNSLDSSPARSAQSQPEVGGSDPPDAGIDKTVIDLSSDEDAEQNNNDVEQHSRRQRLASHLPIIVDSESDEDTADQNFLSLNVRRPVVVLSPRRCPKQKEKRKSLKRLRRERAELNRSRETSQNLRVRRSGRKRK